MSNNNRRRPSAERVWGLSAISRPYSELSDRPVRPRVAGGRSNRTAADPCGGRVANRATTVGGTAIRIDLDCLSILLDVL